MSNASLTPGTYVWDRGGIGMPRVEVIALIGADMVEIQPRFSDRTHVVPMERLAFNRRNLTPYQAAGC